MAVSKMDEKGSFAEVPDNAKIKVGKTLDAPSLTIPEFDPWKDLKTEPEKYYYRGISNKRHIMDRRKAEGYEIVQDERASHGDLVLARMSWDKRKHRVKYKDAKADNMQRAAVDRFKEEADRSKVKTFQD